MLKSKLIVAALAAAFSFGAAAEQREARPFWEAALGEAGFLVADSPSTVSRAAVREALYAAIAAGELDRYHGEHGHSFRDAPATRSRTEVRAELQEALRLGLADVGEAGPRPTTAAEEAMIAAAGKAAAESVAAARRNRVGS